MSESIHEQIAAALVTSLEGIVGDGGTTYWYTPSTVKRVTFFPEEQNLDLSYDVIYLLRPGDEDIVEEETSQGCRGQAEFFLVVAYRHQVATENPFLEEAPTRWTIANRLVRDAVKCLLTDVTLGGLVINILTTSLSVDRDRYLPSWVIAELRFVVEYPFVGSAP